MKAQVRTTINRRKIKQMQEANARGLADMGQAILDTARVPDAPPYGRGLIETGAYVVTRDGNDVAGTAEVPRGQGGRGAYLAVGYDFPGRFLEGGTIKMAAQPFVGPAADEVIPHKDEYIRKAHKRAGTI